ncbi:hypothetical protein EDEG_00895 [Edhazardia aedis USNM 41457]|uniref:Uncharacterized protein n=1 Tax=Edhazardia aedis (strain USNM 41457) TaxID=1003232 RepID=J9DUM9_EDHAE|nr:hypothetical protein EDEG_00895 [Edhazardia aedis USNM 41457]|eukprot:EJW05002.1 hypothetical protein EDEG_00895 [Edhazardia aedis USNM 41457]
MLLLKNFKKTTTKQKNIVLWIKKLQKSIEKSIVPSKENNIYKEKRKCQGIKLTNYLIMFILFLRTFCSESSNSNILLNVYMKYYDNKEVLCVTYDSDSKIGVKQDLGSSENQSNIDETSTLLCQIQLQMISECPLTLYTNAEKDNDMLSGNSTNNDNLELLSGNNKVRIVVFSHTNSKKLRISKEANSEVEIDIVKVSENPDNQCSLYYNKIKSDSNEVKTPYDEFIEALKQPQNDETNFERIERSMHNFLMNDYNSKFEIRKGSQDNFELPFDLIKNKDILGQKINSKQETIEKYDLDIDVILAKSFPNLKKTENYIYFLHALAKLQEEIMGSIQHKNVISSLNYIKQAFFQRNGAVLCDILDYVLICFNNRQYQSSLKTNDIAFEKCSESKHHESMYFQKAYETVDLGAEFKGFADSFFDLAYHYWKNFFCFTNKLNHKINHYDPKLEDKIYSNNELPSKHVITEIYPYYYPFYFFNLNIGGSLIIYGYNPIRLIPLIKFFDQVIDDITILIDENDIQNSCNFKSEEQNNEVNFTSELQTIISKIFILALRDGFIKHKIKNCLTTIDPDIYEKNHIISKMKCTRSAYESANRTKNKIIVYILFPPLDSMDSDVDGSIEKTKIFIGYKK